MARTGLRNSASGWESHALTGLVGRTGVTKVGVIKARLARQGQQVVISLNAKGAWWNMLAVECALWLLRHSSAELPRKTRYQWHWLRSRPNQCTSHDL